MFYTTGGDAGMLELRWLKKYKARKVAIPVVLFVLFVLSVCICVILRLAYHFGQYLVTEETVWISDLCLISTILD